MYYCYTRKSTQEQNETSYEVQQDFLIKQAKELNQEYTVINETGSGKDIDGRPQFKELLSKTASGDIVGAYDSSRIARNTEDALSIARLLNFKGVRLHVGGKFIDVENPIDKMLWTVQSGFDSYQREIQRKKSIEGMTKKRENGDWVPSSMMGYDINHSKKNPVITVNSDAKYVEYAYKKFVDGHSYRSIAIDLSEVLNKRMKTSTIIQWIRNPVYMGYYFRQTVEKAKDRSTLYKREKTVIEQDLIKANKVPQIVSEELWWSAHSVEMRAVRQQYWNRTRTYHELTSILKCADCNTASIHCERVDRRHMNHITKVCYELCRHEPSCSYSGISKVFDAEMIENIARTTYIVTMLSGNNTEVFFKERKNELLADTKEIKAQITKIDSLIETNKRKQTKFVSLLSDDDEDLDLTQFKVKLKELQSECNELSARKDDYLEQLAIRESDITDMLKELTEDKIDYFIHKEVAYRNEAYKKVCSSFLVDSECIKVDYNNGMSYVVSLNEKNKQWPVDIEIKVFFSGKHQYSILYDRFHKKLSYKMNNDCIDIQDPFVQSSLEYEHNLVEKANEQLQQLILCESSEREAKI